MNKHNEEMYFRYLRVNGLIPRYSQFKQKKFLDTVNKVKKEIPYYVKLRQKSLKGTRWVRVLRISILQRDNYTCQYCGKEGKDMVVDHVIPTSKGGATIPSNLKTACFKCNSLKRAKDLKVFIEKIKPVIKLI